MKLTSILLAASAMVAAAGAHAQSTTIDFSQYANGTPITKIGDVTFSMSGGPSTATTPVAADVFGNGAGVALTNSDSGFYPTNSLLTVSFGQAVSDLSFTFNNFGIENGSFYSTYAADGSMIGQSTIDYSNNYTTPIAALGSGIKTLTFDNNQGGNNNWQFGVGKISFTEAAAPGAVPEPATWAMMMLGMGAIGYSLRRRSKVTTKVSFA